MSMIARLFILTSIIDDSLLFVAPKILVMVSLMMTMRLVSTSKQISSLNLEISFNYLNAIHDYLLLSMGLRDVIRLQCLC
jgi:hypothetical protein